MSTLSVANVDPVSKQAWERLLIAFALSLFLHLALMLGVPVNPTGGVPFVTTLINARLEPAASETPAATLVESPLPDIAPNVTSDEARITDRLAEPVEKKPEPQPERASAAPASTPSAGIEVPLIRDPTYYPARQLDVYPRLTAEIEQPPCPPAANGNRVNGEALILLLINEFGLIDDISIVETKPEGYFEEYALALFRGKRFYPGERQGRAVKSRAPIRVRFMCGDVENAAR